MTVARRQVRTPGSPGGQTMTRIWQMMMPAREFAGVKELIRKSIGNDWAELSRRIPTIERRGK